jgi:hypothetical protein
LQNHYVIQIRKFIIFFANAAFCARRKRTYVIKCAIARGTGLSGK